MQWIDQVYMRECLVQFWFSKFSNRSFTIYFHEVYNVSCMYNNKKKTFELYFLAISLLDQKWWQTNVVIEHVGCTCQTN